MLWVALSPASSPVWFQTGGVALLLAVPDVISLCLGLLMKLLSLPLCSALQDGGNSSEDSGRTIPTEQPNPCCSLRAS